MLTAAGRPRYDIQYPRHSGHGQPLQRARRIPYQSPHVLHALVRPGAPRRRRQMNRRSRFEHVFVEQKDQMGLFVRTICIARARVKIGMSNLVYSFKTLVRLLATDRRTRLSDGAESQYRRRVNSTSLIRHSEIVPTSPQLFMGGVVLTDAQWVNLESPYLGKASDPCHSGDKARTRAHGLAPRQRQT